MCSHLLTKIISNRQSEDCSKNEILLETFPKPVKDTFRLPMEYLEEKDIHKISQEVCDDLELLQNNTLSQTETKPLFEYLYEPKGPFSGAVLPKLAGFFTSNRQHLLDTQQVVISRKATATTTTPENDNGFTNEEEQQVLDVWNDLTNNPDFLEKYGYVEWNSVKHLNRSSTFLQFLSLLNGVIPMFNLLMSILLAILPFFILLYAGQQITLGSYTECLQQIGGNNQMFCKMISMLDAENFNPQNAVIFLLMLALYSYQIYQNIVHTERFYQHLTEVTGNLFAVKKFVKGSQQRFEEFVKNKPNNISTYNLFYMNVENHIHLCKKLSDVLDGVVSPDEIPLFRYFTNMGEHFRLYYHLYDNEEAQQVLLFCMNMNGYLDLLDATAKHLETGNVHLATFPETQKEEENPKKDEEETQQGGNAIKGLYYPSLVGKTEIVKNDIDLKRHIILTGPNASGKTTLLKAIAINTLLSQQVGLGFYDEYALVEPYRYVHSYLNIPDTSERDSLFEAETRRCKKILEKIANSSTGDRHLCIFDELFSGTNPVDASSSAYSFLKHLCSHYPQVDFVLTTHYTDICRKIEDTEPEAKERQMTNYQMSVLENENHFLTMTYQMVAGISEIKGASHILENMGFPDEIVQEVRTSKKH